MQDEGQRRRHRKKGTKREYSDQVLDEAKDIFGVEDLDEFYEDEGLFPLFLNNYCYFQFQKYLRRNLKRVKKAFEQRDQEVPRSHYWIRLNLQNLKRGLLGQRIRKSFARTGQNVFRYFYLFDKTFIFIFLDSQNSSHRN